MRRQFLNFMKIQSIPAIVLFILYSMALIIFVNYANHSSLVYYPIEPYIWGAKTLDFFFPIIVGLPFALFTYFLRKDYFLTYTQLRMKKEKYLFTFFLATSVCCSLTVFLVNYLGVVFSVKTAHLTNDPYIHPLADYFLGNWQMMHPLLFGLIWSVIKAIVGVTICLFAQIWIFFVDNLFLGLLAPFTYVVLENFITAILQIPHFSLTSLIVLNRLAPGIITPIHLLTIYGIFCLVIVSCFYILRKWQNAS